MSEFKCLTVRQPWAWALIHGEKRIENRTWPTKHRGPLLIHAGASRVEIGRHRWEPAPSEFKFGAIIGVVDLVDCVPYDQIAADPWAEPGWCWVVENPRPLGPLFCKGSLGLFSPPITLDGALASEILRGLPSGRGA